jgi:hypothetical protein
MSVGVFWTLSTHEGAPAPLSTSHQALGPFRNTADGFLLKVVVLTESFLPFRAGALFSTDGDASPFVSSRISRIHDSASLKAKTIFQSLKDKWIRS